MLVAAWLTVTLGASDVEVVVLPSAGVSEATVRRLQRASETVLKDLTSLTPVISTKTKSGSKSCGEECLRALVVELASPVVFTLDVAPPEGKSERWSGEASLWIEGKRAGARRLSGGADGSEDTLRGALETMLPGWLRRGFGGVRLSNEPGAVVKVDGRVTTPDASGLLAVPAGVHQVDVVNGAGEAVLQRVSVGEGRKETWVRPPAQEVSVRASRGFGLRGVAFGSFMLGAASLAGGLVAGALSRWTGDGLTSCQGDSRSCATLDLVLERQAQAQAYATTGNVLLGVGGGLLALGLGLFVVDLVLP